jgi:hypothetical protein
MNNFRAVNGSFATSAFIQGRSQPDRTKSLLKQSLFLIAIGLDC